MWKWSGDTQSRACGPITYLSNKPNHRGTNSSSGQPTNQIIIVVVAVVKVVVAVVAVGVVVVVAVVKGAAASAVAVKASVMTRVVVLVVRALLMLLAELVFAAVLTAPIPLVIGTSVLAPPVRWRLRYWRWL